MNILTFDIEEWFHLLDNDSTKTINDWNNFDSRIKLGMEYIYEIIESNKVSATFFVLGWMAKKHPDIIKKISDLGYEIGSHTHLHQLVYEQDKKVFYNDVEKSIKTLEDCTGKKITCFRAPGFSITEKNKWAFEILYDLGIKIDCSVFPAGRAHGGIKTYKSAYPSILHYNNITLKEFPINTFDFFGKSIIFSGGGYFRLFPYNVIKHFSNRSDYIMTYFHPRDFDYSQPTIPGLTALRKFKSYVGLKGCQKKLQNWLNDFEFIDLREANKKINWENAPNIYL
jgi:polysaccharide deacetylase family protein (PEP-CTERM system associated)